MKPYYLLIIFIFSCFNCHQRPGEKIATVKSCCTWKDINAQINTLDSALDDALARCSTLEIRPTKKIRATEIVSPQGPSTFINNNDTTILKNEQH